MQHVLKCNGIPQECSEISVEKLDYSRSPLVPMFLDILQQNISVSPQSFNQCVLHLKVSVSNFHVLHVFHDTLADIAKIDTALTEEHSSPLNNVPAMIYAPQHILHKAAESTPGCSSDDAPFGRYDCVQKGGKIWGQINVPSGWIVT